MIETSDITSEDEKLSGRLAIVMGGVRRTLPALTLKPGRKWLETMAAKVGPISGLTITVDPSDPTSWDSLPVNIGKAQDVMVELIAAYDVTDALGGRDGIEEKAYGHELQAVINAMVSSVLPFVPQAVAPGSLVAGPSPEPSSTNGHSPTGGSTPKPSKSASPQDG